MSSAFFRRPGEESSDSSSGDGSTEDIDHSQQSNPSYAGPELDLAPTESLSTDASLPQHELQDAPEQANIPGLDKHRDFLFAALLEEFCKTRASELINNGNPGVSYDRQSSEVQPLAQKLYQEASQVLSLNGFLPANVTSMNYSSMRDQYLAGLDSLSLRNVEDREMVPVLDRQQLGQTEDMDLIQTGRRGSAELIKAFESPVGSILMQTAHMNVSSPHSDIQMTFSHSSRSHYESCFQQMRLLGKGGFGRVYHAWNIFDKKEYAVKKIPLSPKLSERYRQSGHRELDKVLREVQALAQLEHSNCVRYHACWLEEPRSPTIQPPTKPARPVPAQRLLTNRPYVSNSFSDSSLKPPPLPRDTHQNGAITFGYDNSSRRSSYEIESGPSHPPEWSLAQDSSQLQPSGIFTDGHAHGHMSSNETDTSIDHSLYVLHIQMSHHPLTLTQYLSPPPPPPLTSTLKPATTPPRRHCFHLVPSLRILLGILCGLQYIHAKGLIHRDIKPSNIFLSTLTSDTTNLANLEGFYDAGSCPSCPSQEAHWVNPRIGDFGLVAELARSAALDAEHSDYPSPAAHSNGHENDHGKGHALPKPVGTEFYRPPHPPPHSPLLTPPWTTDTPLNDPSRNSPISATISTIPVINEKLDVFALGVIFVEMLTSTATASERAHVLRNLQSGVLPGSLAANIDAEGLNYSDLGDGHRDADAGTAEDSASGSIKDKASSTRGSEGLSSMRNKLEAMISGMIQADPRQRWSCARVRETVLGMLSGVVSGGDT